MLKTDEFQGRLNTPSALIRKGNSSQAVLNPQPKPVIRAVAVPKNAGDTLEQNTPRHNAVMKLLRDSNNYAPTDDDTQLASIATRNELVLNGKSLGKLAFIKKAKAN